MIRQHEYAIHLTWTGNLGSGTLDYRAYSRDHEIAGAEKLTGIPGSSDPAFRGDRRRYNPEEMFLSSIASCHMLWYLHLAAIEGIIVLEYEDEPRATLAEQIDGSGRFTSVELRPRVRVSKVEHTDRANALHELAGKKCFIANSLSIPIAYSPRATA